jgi:hypothetical protein
MCLQRLFVTWLERAKSQENTQEPDWHAAKLVFQQYKDPVTNSKTIWTSMIDAEAVVYGCIPKLRPKYSFPDRDQADLFLQAMALVEQDRLGELSALGEDDDEEAAADFTDDDLEDFIE